MSKFLTFLMAPLAAQALLACGGNSGATPKGAGGSSAGGSASGSTVGGTSAIRATGGSGGNATSAGGTSNVTGGSAGTGGSRETSGGASSAGGGTPATGGTRSSSSVLAGGTSAVATATGGIASTGGASAIVTGGYRSTGGAPSCPTSSAYVGKTTWKHQITVTSGAQYCGEQLEIRTLEQEFATKAKLTIAPGTYPLPEASGNYEFALPVCFDLGSRGPAPAFAGAGSLKTTRYNIGTPYINYAQEFNQPLSSADSSTWFFGNHISYWDVSGQDPVTPVLDGSLLFQWGDVGHNSVFILCEGDSCAEWNDVWFADCDPPFKLYRHTVTFEGGQVVLDVRIDGSPGISAMPAAFMGARGTLDGTAFTQNDYWKLVYSAPHHHFTRNFAVLFDAPINGACGLKVLDIDAYDRALPTVYTIQCDLSNIATRSVSAATSQLP